MLTRQIILKMVDAKRTQSYINLYCKICSKRFQSTTNGQSSSSSSLSNSLMAVRDIKMTVTTS